MLFYQHYDLINGPISLISVLKPKSLNYPQPTFFIVNSDNTSLLGSNINKNYI